MLSNFTKEEIAFVIIEVLLRRFESFPDDVISNRNAPFHEAFLKAFSNKLCGKVTDAPFLISLSSWLHGLNTTIGQTFFEKTAHILCSGEKRGYTGEKFLKITKTQQEAITNIMTNLCNTGSPNLPEENGKILKIDNSDLVDAKGFTADVYFEDKDGITAIELKSVKPNSGEMKSEKEKILYGKAALYKNCKGEKKVSFYIGFPFDPTVDTTHESPCSFDKGRFLDSIIGMRKFFSNEETLVGSELWDFLSGEEETMEQVIEIINAIAKPDFLDVLRYINDIGNRKETLYKKYLSQWYLRSELEIIDFEARLPEIMKNDRILERNYNNLVFDSKGKYNRKRQEIIKEALKKQH